MERTLGEIGRDIAVVMEVMADFSAELGEHIKTTELQEDGLTPAGANVIREILRVLHKAADAWATHGDDFEKACGVEWDPIPIDSPDPVVVNIMKEFESMVKGE